MDNQPSYPPNYPSQPPHAGTLEIRQGPYFQYAVPAGWQVVEDGQYAVVLMAPDRGALTVLVGNAGLPANYNPAQFIFEKLAQTCPENLQLGQGRQAQPLPGCAVAFAYDYIYTVNGVPCRGVATCSIAPSYDMCTLVMTCAASYEAQWGWYAAWLPQVASQVVVTSANAFGSRGIAQQNLTNSIALGEQARQYRAWSQHTWDEVVRQRGASQDRHDVDFRQNLGNVQTYTDPYGSQPIELSNAYSYYWMTRQGRIVGTNDPSANPNHGSTEEWLRLHPSQP